jgi:hypothetical protein
LAERTGPPSNLLHFLGSDAKDRERLQETGALHVALHVNGVDESKRESELRARSIKQQCESHSLSIVTESRDRTDANGRISRTNFWRLGPWSKVHPKTWNRQ